MEMQGDDIEEVDINDLGKLYIILNVCRFRNSLRSRGVAVISITKI